MLKIGDTAPDFELLDESGTPRTLSLLLKDGPVVLFFYPAAMTRGCTAEACHFRDIAGDFATVGAQRVGISADQVEKQKRFADKHSLGYPLLSDPDRIVADEFGATRAIGPIKIPNKRVTFVIDTDRTVLDVIASEVSMDTHADKALETLRKRDA
ncbi:MAG: thioredoxin-dependent peroxiredoxin [Actinomycetota bacterium]|jgi:peroxiredoxin Q/BCP